MAEEPKSQRPPTGTGVKPVRIVGPVAPAVYTKEGKSGIFKPAAAVGEALVTEGMKARQRDLEKKKRVNELLRQVEEEETAMSWRRTRGWIFRLVAVALLVAAYAKLQMTYGNRWPLWTVWIFLGGSVIAALSWMFWYLDYSD